MAFREINESWIAKFFALEERDREILNNPAKYILAPGGEIVMAVAGETIVGCCALLPMEDGSFEVSKMGVAEPYRGQGIGRRLLASVIGHARALGIRRLYLETNQTLANAIHLYEALGFRDLPPERIHPSPYARANVYMEMLLE
jgi:N-acetylglutamate synthase-like GNAT family acetyltransferase